MLRLDKLKIVSDKRNIKRYDSNIFDSVVRDGEITTLQYKISNPYLLSIKIDNIAEELVIEFSGKILQKDYPKLISRETIRECFEHINAIGICHLDIDGLMDSKVVKCDVTRDIDFGDISGLTQYISTHLRNYRQYVSRRLRNGNFIVEKNVVTKQSKKRLTIYDKGAEMRKVDNVRFMEMYGIAVDSFATRCRFELNLNSEEQIKRSLGIGSNRLCDVLATDSNPIWDFVDELVSENEDMEYSDRDSYFKGLLLKDCDYDVVKVETKIRELYPSKGSNIRKLMKPYKVLLAKIGQHSSKPMKRILQGLLLMEIFLILPIFLWA